MRARGRPRYLGLRALFSSRPTARYGTAIEMAIDDAAIDPEQAALRGAESRLLANAVAELPLVYREVLILRELEELSYKEIARIADIPVGTVMSRLARARSLLQRSPLLHAAR